MNKKIKDFQRPVQKTMLGFLGEIQRCSLPLSSTDFFIASEEPWAPV